MIDTEDSESPLTSLTVKEFVKSVCDRTPAPGGGSVAALVGALVGLLYVLSLQIREVSGTP